MLKLTLYNNLLDNSYKIDKFKHLKYEQLIRFSNEFFFKDYHDNNIINLIIKDFKYFKLVLRWFFKNYQKIINKNNIKSFNELKNFMNELFESNKKLNHFLNKILNWSLKFDNFYIFNQNKINILQENFRKLNKKLKSLKPVIYKNFEINYYDIFIFNKSNRKNNNLSNSKREQIIFLIFNNLIPDDYYISLKWRNQRKLINDFIDKLCSENNINKIISKKCILKGGRSNNYDFEFIINKKYNFKVEYKFNSSSINDTPQFVSPSKPSQYLDISYEEYFYENYISKIMNKNDIPTKDEYINNIHSTKPNFMVNYQNKYYKGCSKSSQYTSKQDDIDFYNKCKMISEESINKFIEMSKLNINKITDYLVNSQKDKYYMCQKDNKICLEKVNINDLKIISVKNEPSKKCFICKTQTNKQIKILLRWKNGNGIAYPAFQISNINRKDIT